MSYINWIFWEEECYAEKNIVPQEERRLWRGSVRDELDESILIFFIYYETSIYIFSRGFLMTAKPIY